MPHQAAGNVASPRLIPSGRAKTGADTKPTCRLECSCGPASTVSTVSTIDPWPMIKCQWDGDAGQMESECKSNLEGSPNTSKYLPNTCHYHSNSGNIGGTSAAFWLYQGDHKIPTELVSPKICQFWDWHNLFLHLLWWFRPLENSSHLCCWCSIQFNHWGNNTSAPLESIKKCHFFTWKEHINLIKCLNHWIFGPFSIIFLVSPQPVLGRCWERPWSRTHGWHLRKLFCHEYIYIYIYI